MISPKTFHQELYRNKVRFFSGVPDSLLKPFCAYIEDVGGPSDHVIAANEGAAISLAIGHHIATGALGLVYMQNSGLGNAINPLVSLADPEIYGIPMILMIGWRGEPGIQDEPQHIKQGAITENLLHTLGIDYLIVDHSTQAIADVIEQAVTAAKANSRPFALLIRKGTFSGYSPEHKNVPKFGWRREEAIQAIMTQLNDDDIVISTTGKASRELYELRKGAGHDISRDFLTVGGMGHASQIAFGIASQHHDLRVICLDGDGAALMHLGSWTIQGSSSLSNYYHIILNNGAHDSVGGQPTVAHQISFTKIASHCGYKTANTIDSPDNAANSLNEFFSLKGPALLECKIDRGSRSDLGRPSSSPSENMLALMQRLNKG